MVPESGRYARRWSTRLVRALPENCLDVFGAARAPKLSTAPGGTVFYVALRKTYTASRRSGGRRPCCSSYFASDAPGTSRHAFGSDKMKAARISVPYRRPLDGVLQRCENLRLRLQTQTGMHVPVRACSELDDALAWERELRARLETSDNCELANTELDAAVIVPGTRRGSWSLRRFLVYMLVVSVSITLLVGELRKC